MAGIPVSVVGAIAGRFSGWDSQPNALTVASGRYQDEAGLTRVAAIDAVAPVVEKRTFAYFRERP